MIRFFLNINFENIKFITLDKGKAQQLRKVLRVKVGQDLELFNNQNQKAIVQITKLLRESCDCKIIETENIAYEINPIVNIFQALPKNTKVEFLVQKCTELGVSSITFFKSDRSVVKVNIDSQNKLNRLRKVAEEAAEQCGRYSVPEIIFSNNSLEKLIENNTYYLHKACSNKVDSVNKDLPVNVLIGPEGGFSEREFKVLEDKAMGISVSKFTLRAETAPIAFLAQISL